MDALFADILAQGLDLRLKVTGRSMAPFIKSGEIVILRKVPTDSLHNSDIIYFVDATGSAVLHRIIAIEIKKSGKSFTTRGDAQLQHDAPIPEDQVLAKAVYVEKVIPLIGPMQIDIDSGLSKTLNLAFRLYRKARHKFLNRILFRNIFHNIQ